MLGWSPPSIPPLSPPPPRCPSKITSAIRCNDIYDAVVPPAIHGCGDSETIPEHNRSQTPVPFRALPLGKSFLQIGNPRGESRAAPVLTGRNRQHAGSSPEREESHRIQIIHRPARNIAVLMALMGRYQLLKRCFWSSSHIPHGNSRSKNVFSLHLAALPEPPWPLCCSRLQIITLLYREHNRLYAIRLVI